jgi:hypothetical protein
MHVDVFIRTYHKDLPWLEYALRSIHKYVTGHRRIIVAIPEGQGHLLSHLTAETVIEVPDLDDGYLGQQLTKLQSWRYTDADAIIFWDSDVVATEPIDIHAEYFKDGKPILYKTRYTSLPKDVPWKAITSKAIGFEVEWEYMRRMPLVYWRDSLQDAEHFLAIEHLCSPAQYLSQQPQGAFSEFNFIGANVDTFEPDEYTIIDTESVTMPPNKVHQFWSWGGITPDIKAQLEKICS